MRVIKITEDKKIQYCNFYGFYQKIYFKGLIKKMEIVALIGYEGCVYVEKLENLLFSENAFSIWDKNGQV